MGVPSVSVSAAILAAAAPALAARAGSSPVLAAPVGPASVSPASASPASAAPVAAAPAAAAKAAVEEASAKASPAAVFPISVTNNGLLIGQEQKGVPFDLAFADIAEATARLSSERKAIYAQVRRQAQGWHRLSLVSATVGFGIIALAVVALLLNYTKTGLVTTASSVVPNAVASLFFVQARRADTRLDGIGRDLAELREKYEMMQMANTIDDSRIRDALKAEIVRKFVPKSRDAAS